MVIDLSRLGQPVRQCLKRFQSVIIIDALKRQYVRGRLGNNLDNRTHLRIGVCPYVSQCQPRPVAGQFCVECGNSDGVGVQRSDGRKEECSEDPQRPCAQRLMRPVRPRLRPRHRRGDACLRSGRLIRARADAGA